MTGVPREYLGLMRNAIKKSDSTPSERPLKRRKRNRRDKKDDLTEDTGSQDTEPQGISNDQAIVVDDSSDDVPSRKEELNAIPVIDLSDRDDTPDIKATTSNGVSGYNSASDINAEITVDDDGEDEEDDDEFDDVEFEDVDMNSVTPRPSSNLAGDISIQMDKPDPKKKRKTKAKNVIDREERLFRKQFHRNYIAIMSIHGFIRNRWCNNKSIHNSIMKLISPSIYDELHPSKNDVKTPHIRTRRFLDGLRHLLDRWTKYYKVTSNKGIFKHDWYDWYGYEKTSVPFSRFSKCISKGRGNRDIGAQGFVALLRAAGVPSRLVFSLQPPDFTSMAIKKKPEESDSKSQTDTKSAQDKLLELRKGKVSTSVDQKVLGEVELNYPVFWAEAWDPSSKTWITIDPIQFKIIENVKLKSKLEPPANYPYNNLIYVLGYDRKGGVRDITKRYAEKYYARTRKKRITKDEADEIWYSDFMESLSTRERNRSDDHEDEYFKKKATLEGMPDNIQDFKNHPFYVLESHLRANEILHPKEHCGMIRTKGKNDSIKVYRRENVQTLRSPRGWFQRGRILKTGERPMLVRKKTPAQMKDDDDDPDERLYAIFQTSVYVPPPVQDGLITKNSYGNIDVYVPSMIPEGAVLISTPFASDAAKLIGIDYAPAVVGFKFERRGATPKIEGVVVAEEFKEAVESVQEQLKEESIEKQRSELEIRALKGWSLLLAKLRIKQRLNAQHGKVDEDADGSEDEYAELEREYEEYLENDESDDDMSQDEVVEEPEYGPGGFIVERGGPQPDYGAGGFIQEDEVEEASGGFINEEEEEDEDGFLGEEGDVSARNGGFRDPKTIHNDYGGGFLVEDDQEKYGHDDSDGELYHTSGRDTANKRRLNDNMDRVPHKDKYDGLENDSDGIDEYEAFFDQLQNDQGEDSDDNDEIVDEKESSYSEANELTENLDPDVPEQTLNENSQADPSSPERESFEEEVVASPAKDIGSNESEYESAIENIKETPVQKAITDEYDEELEKQFNEQLKQEESQKLSQSTNGGSNQDEDYDFDYDTE